jgi:hypothetical protein
VDFPRKLRNFGISQDGLAGRGQKGHSGVLAGTGVLKPTFLGFVVYKLFAYNSF